MNFTRCSVISVSSRGLNVTLIRGMEAVMYPLILTFGEHFRTETTTNTNHRHNGLV